MSHEQQGQGLVDVDLAKSFVPLNAISKNHLENLLLTSTVNDLIDQQLIFERGDRTPEHYFLLHGHAKLIYASGHVELIDAATHRATLINELPRPCRCVAEGDATVLVVGSDVLDKAVSWSQISDYLASEVGNNRDYDVDAPWIQSIIHSNLFYKVPPVNVQQILPKLTAKKVRASEVIVAQGETGDSCYFIKQGRASVTRIAEGNAFQRLAEISEGRCFGEDALLFDAPRNATVTMTSDGELMVLTKNDFQMLLEEPPVDALMENELGRLAHPVIYIDVRTQAEYDQGHLLLSANIPLNILNLKQRMLSPDKHYLFYCDTGRRSSAAAHLLSRLGFHCSMLKGGLLGAGMQHELVTDSAYVIKNGELQKA